MIDIGACYARLAKKEALAEDEVVALLKELEHYRGSVAYLASCQAATLEGLPKSYSKSGRGRHVELCKTAAAMLEGDSSRVRYPTQPEHARNRCLQAVEKHQAN